MSYLSVYMTLATNYKPIFPPLHILSPSARGLNERMGREDNSSSMKFMCVV